MKRFLVALSGLLIFCGSTFACTIYDYEVASIDLDKGIAEIREIPKYSWPGSCDLPGGKSGGFEKPKPTATDIHNKYKEIQHRKQMGMQTGSQEKELAEMLAK